MKLSGWCSPAWGVCESKRAHAECQRRMDKGLLHCECVQFNGHETVSELSVPRETIGETKSGPAASAIATGPSRLNRSRQ